MTLDIIFSALIIAALSLCIFARFLPKVGRIIFPIIVFVLAARPYPYGAAEYLLSYLSSFSISTVCIACFAIVCRIKDAPCAFEQQKLPLYGLILLCAFVLYPSALGAFSWDLYAIGYSNTVLQICILLLAISSLLFGYYVLCLIISAAFFAYAFDWLVSDNLWDYLIDPFIVFIATSVLLRRLILAIRQKKPSSY